MGNKNKRLLYIMITIAAMACDIVAVVFWSFLFLVVGNVLALIAMIGFGKLGKESRDKVSMVFYGLAMLSFGGGILAIVVMVLLVMGVLWVFGHLFYGIVKFIQGVSKIG